MRLPTNYQMLVYGRFRSKFQGEKTPFKQALEVAAGWELRAALERLNTPPCGVGFHADRIRIIRQRLDEVIEQRTKAAQP